ncbi:MAG TPA: T9SS type A sorting domain-containing protein [Bacteroidia bacterium]|nr:T9SS type A sorting domain-containing protein [Bacteroidia bacterium]
MVNSLKIKLVLLCLMVSSSIYSQNYTKALRINGNLNSAKLSTIGAGDSVVFDLSQINLSTSPLEIPVSIISDDTIYALDFSLKYDHNALEYDTILDLTTYLMPLSYYNSNDSTVRFTSSSFQPCDTLTPLALVCFNLLTPTFSNTDLYSLKAYLNGNQCNIKIVFPTILSVPETSTQKFNLYPNPAINKTTIDGSEEFQLMVFNQLGVSVFPETIYSQNNSATLNLESLKSGMYFFEVKNKKGTSVKKLFVCH